jgi:hypothetical protein
MPRMTTIAAGEKKVFRTGATPVLHGAASRGALSAPRYVRVKVSVLRNPEVFAPVKTEQLLSDAQFDQWLSANDSIFLNTVPVRFAARRVNGFAGADQRGTGGF